MQVVYGNIDRVLYSDGLSCALGFFDGVHLGHRKIINTVKDQASKYKLNSMIFTFEKHPLMVLDRKNAPERITDNKTKAEIFNELGIDILNLNPVDREFLSIEPEAFIKDILVDRFNVKSIVVGFNFRFGNKGIGDTEYLSDCCSKMKIMLSIIKPICIDGKVISSTTIRNLIKSGDILNANVYLGRNYSISGKVLYGKRIGRNIGFPTANIDVPFNCVVPKNGVYITRVIMDNKTIDSITNIGLNPTFNGKSRTIETHIIDYDGDIYGREIKIIFYDRIRDDISFNNINELSNQILNDKITTENYFNSIRNQKPSIL